MASVTERLTNVLNSACVAFGVSMAKDTGILQALLDSERPLTSQEIADNKSLKERYVREILSSLGTAELLHMITNEKGQLFFYLEEDEKKALKSPLYGFISFPLVFSPIYEQVKSCFMLDGPYGTRYTDTVHNIIDEMNVSRVDIYSSLFLEHTDDLKEKLESGIQVIEFGSGRGRLIAKLATMFPNSTFTTSENVEKLLDLQRERWGHIPNISYKLYDLCALPENITEQYNWAFCVDVIHDLPKPLEALKGICSLLKAGTGVFTFIDVASSGSPIEDKGNMSVACFYSAGSFLCIPESYQHPDSMALGPCWGRQTAINLATAAGFQDVKDYPADKLQRVFVCKP
ncbi:hypothetical protein Bpfe_010686 [Biomphalaria pfeifferi]|uniref:Methyltransferase domain-containing protein n=1 Tax=Biomphalaria pfeifferi TaxID=112525 RepID=A0AAD8BTK9_BIOPF|nr:hypothetical protein Bpfe_010686 [Biomphalaria pfeifferi]